MLTLHLPVPMSVNGMYANVAKVGRVKTKAYKAWIVAAGWELRSQFPKKVPGRVVISIKIKRERGDVDNKIKCCLDLLVNHDIIDDDRNVERVTAEWADVPGAVVTVVPA